MENVILNNDFATVWVYPEKQIVHHKIKKFIYGDHFREVMMAAADAFIKNACTKWLSDDRENSSLRNEDQEWAKLVWEPKVMKGGWKHWAVIFPKGLFGELNMKRISQHYIDQGINFNTFSDTNEALAWLEKQSNSSKKLSNQSMFR